ncbi:hypothetical protein BDW74DRAFT_147614 [Aspergillus multicolor]|uniref:uncharacterized protein n=1 Tax=Aspergillus multicolor TaxID=41759 RepID=UPI003CCDE54C
MFIHPSLTGDLGTTLGSEAFQGSLTAVTRRSILRGASQGLAYTHERDVLHNGESIGAFVCSSGFFRGWLAGSDGEPNNYSHRL